MYRVFTNPVLANTGKSDHPNFITVRRLIKSEVNKMLTYYRNSSMTVSSNHLVKQILEQLNVSMKRDLESYVGACHDEVSRLARLFGLVHYEIRNPEPKDGIFYAKGIPEFIIADETTFNPIEAYRNWDKLSPIKIRYHPFSDLNYPLLNGHYKNPVREKGYVIISINIPLLALQYRAWLKEKSKTGDNFDRMGSFILRYPIANMVYRHTEIAIINRTIKTYTSEPVAKFYRLHPYNVVDHSKLVDEVLLKRAEIIKTRQINFDELFNLFNTIYGYSWRQIAKPPKMVHTRNTKWVLDLQVLHLLEFWLRAKRSGNVLTDRSITNKITRHIRNMENDAVYYKTNSIDMIETFKKLRKELESG